MYWHMIKTINFLIALIPNALIIVIKAHPYFNAMNDTPLRTSTEVWIFKHLQNWKEVLIGLSLNLILPMWMLIHFRS